MSKLWDPFLISPKRGCVLTIRRKDRLDTVATELARSLPISCQAARESVAFYFALGARLRARKLGGRWMPSELSVLPNRRYLVD